MRRPTYQRQQLDAEFSAVQRDYFPVVQPVHRHQAMGITGRERLACFSGTRTGPGIYKAICGASGLPNPSRL
jgi:hypothetical protein